MLDPKKYIITTQIEQFRKFMMTDKTMLSIYDNDDSLTWDSLLLNSRGELRSIWTKPSNKFEGDTSISYVHYLAPHKTVTGANLCRLASEECAGACLGYTNRLALHVNKLYADKTVALIKFTELYLYTMVNDMIQKALVTFQSGKRVYFRFNGLSDLPFYRVIDMRSLYDDLMILAALFGIARYDNPLYDYSKYPINASIDGVYRVTYSYNENTQLEYLRRFNSISFVLPKKDKQKLINDYPHTFVDGDYSDVRPLDGSKWVLLSLKGKKQRDTGFVLSYDTIVRMLGLDTGSRFERLITLQQLGFYHLSEEISDGRISFADALSHLEHCRRINTLEEMSHDTYQYAINLVTGLFLEVTC